MYIKQVIFVLLSTVQFACQKPTDKSTTKHEPSHVHQYNILRNFIGTEPIPDNWILQGRVWRNGLVVETWQSPGIPLHSPYNGYILAKPAYLAKQLYFLNGRLWEETDFYFSDKRDIAFVSRTPDYYNEIIEPRLHSELVNKLLRKSYFYFIVPDYNCSEYYFSGNTSSNRWISKEQSDSILYDWKLLSYGSISLVK